MTRALSRAFSQGRGAHARHDAAVDGTTSRPMAGHDALAPSELTTVEEARGEAKADASTIPTFVLALVAGAIIAVGEWFVSLRPVARGPER